MGPPAVIDTNIAIFILKGQLAEPLPVASYYMSIINEMELRAHPDLSPEEEADLFRLLRRIPALAITPTIKEQSIHIRRHYGLKLPDAIICATAVTLNVTLFSNDKKVLRVKELSVKSLEIR